MLLEDMKPFTYSWNMFQLPALNGPRVTASLRSFCAVLQQGWHIEEPVQVLPTAQLENWIYSVTLVSSPALQKRQLFVQAEPETEAFFSQRGIQVVEGHLMDARLEIG